MRTSYSRSFGAAVILLPPAPIILLYVSNKTPSQCKFPVERAKVGVCQKKSAETITEGIDRAVCVCPDESIKTEKQSGETFTALFLYRGIRKN